MNLFQIIQYLHETNRFTIEDLLTLAFKVFGDQRIELVSDPLHPKSPYSKLDKGSIEESVREFINSKISNCTLCNRCNSRTNVVLSDGYFDAQLFVVSDYPDILDDRTSFPLSGSAEIKSSNCVACQNINICYRDRNNLFPIPCEFKPYEKQEAISFNCNKPAVEFPASAFNSIITKLQTEEENSYLSFRKNWDTYLDRSVAKEDVEYYKSYPKVFVTSLVKCFGETIPTDEEIDVCSKWLEIERKLCRAKYTLLLGEASIRTVLGAVNIEEVIDQTHEIEGWGTVVCYYHPREILCDINKLEERIKYCLKINIKKESKVNIEGDYGL